MSATIDFRCWMPCFRALVNAWRELDAPCSVQGEASATWER
jgi:hypothetical protein